MDKSNDILYSAVVNNDLDMVKRLVAQGVDITADDNYAVRAATANRYMDMIKYLVSEGAEDDNYLTRYATAQRLAMP